MASGWRDFETWDGLAKISGVPLKCHAPAFPTRTARVSRKGRTADRRASSGRMVSVGRQSRSDARSIRPKDENGCCMEYPAAGRW